MSERIDFRDGHPAAEWLGAWHDGEVDAVEAGPLKSHIDGCDACRAKLAEMAAIDAAGLEAGPGLPGDEYWPILQNQIMARVRRESASPAAEPATADFAAEDSPRESGSWMDRVLRRFSPAPSFGWAIATTAAIGIVILTARPLMNRLPSVPDRAIRVDEFETPGDAAPPVEQPAGEGSAGRPELKKESAAGPGPARSLRAAPSATAPPREESASAEEADVNEPPRPSVGKSDEPADVIGDESRPAELGTRVDRGRPVAADVAESMDKPAVAGGADTDDARPSPSTGSAPVVPGAPRSKAQAEVTTPLAAGTFDAADPLGYMAEVDRRLKKESLLREGTRSVAPSTSIQERVAESARQFSMPGRKSSFDDYRMVYAAAFRALEAGEYDLALNGFRLVSAAVPESSLARDADFQVRMTDARQRLAGGESVEDVLASVTLEADRAFDAWERDPDKVTCRSALAQERARMELYREYRRGGDGSSGTRIETLERCAS